MLYYVVYVRGIIQDVRVHFKIVCMCQVVIICAEKYEKIVVCTVWLKLHSHKNRCQTFSWCNSSFKSRGYSLWSHTKWKMNSWANTPLDSIKIASPLSSGNLSHVRWAEISCDSCTCIHLFTAVPFVIISYGEKVFLGQFVMWCCNTVCGHYAKIISQPSTVSLVLIDSPQRYHNWALSVISSLAHWGPHCR